MQEFPRETTTFTLPGAVGELEVMTTHPGEDRDTVMVICHPHPLHQGTMHNKVVTTLAKVAERLGMPSVRFNFRGVGASQGTFADAVGEQDDCLAVLAWVKTVLPCHKVILAGFSFGSYVAAAVAAHEEVMALISVAPAVTNYEFSKLSTMGCPWLVVMGEDDEVVSVEAVDAFSHARSDITDYIKLQNCSHFFHGKLIDLRAICDKFLTEC
jgi:uncharacterized protein